MKASSKTTDIVLLLCGFCSHTLTWDRSLYPEGAGYCFCRKAQYLKRLGKNQYFKVLKEPLPPQPRGYVVVMSTQGWQELKAPYYQEDASAWRKVKKAKDV